MSQIATEEVKPSALVAIVAETPQVKTRVVLEEVSVDVFVLKQDASYRLLTLRNLGHEGLQVVIDVLDLRFFEDVSVIIAVWLMNQRCHRRLFEAGDEVWSHCDRAKKSSPLGCFRMKGFIRGCRSWQAASQ
ncbi:hypothetical protein ALP99_200036 [Pseudomonas syringae pv. tomato]|nr:hypothetical protein ALP99_200036 [Pseudomonas syringae pv. tomato]